MRPPGRPTVCIAAALLIVAGTDALGADEADPLFQSHDMLEIRIKGPISSLLRIRSDEEELPATVSWLEGDGRAVEVDVGLRTRGKFRRGKKVCPFPPIRLNFKKSDVENTLFHKQDKLKLVSHCRDRSTRNEQVLLREYLTYRMLNILTDLSYRVRLLQVTYEDTEGKKRERIAYGFLIENDKRLSKRIDLPVVDVPNTTAEELDPAFANLTSVFQYFIGNTDFSAIAGAEGESCCHNASLFGGNGVALFTIPYDFDMSGMVDAPYAGSNPRFNLRSVRQRLYRGRCIHNSQLSASLQTFQDNRQALYDLVLNQEQVKNASKNSMTRYVDSFFKSIDNPKSVDRGIIRACVGSP